MRGFISRMSATSLSVTLLAASAAPVHDMPVVRGDGGKLLVAVQPLADRLGIPVKHQNGALALQVDGTWVRLRADDITLREGDAPMARLRSFPTVHKGRLFIDVADVSTVLDVDARVANGRLSVARQKAHIDTKSTEDDGFNVTELAAPKHAPKPSPSPQTDPYAGKRLLANVSASVSDYAEQRNYNAMLDGGGQHFHALMYVNGMEGSRANVGGTLRVGDAGRKHVSLGGINNPLYGTVFAGGGANGVEGVSESGTFASYSATTVDARRVLAFGRRSGDWVREVALASQFGIFQPLIGIQRWHETPHYVLDPEIWFGMHGIGAGIQYRTTGRLYADTRLAFAGGGLPLVNGDALTQATFGYDVSKTFGVRAGYGIAHAQGGQALLQVYGGNATTSYTLSHFGIQNSAAVDFSRQFSKLRFGYINAPGYSAVENDGTFEMRRGVIETRAYFASGNSTDILADYRFKRETPSLTIGLESVHADNGGRTAPTIGYLFPVGSTLSVGFEFHPLANGNGIRFTAQQAVYGSIAPAQRSVFVDLESPVTAALDLFIDGMRIQRITEQHTKISVASGSHYVSVQSEDHRVGSPEERVLDGAPSDLTLPLWPVTDVHGVVRLPDMPLGMVKPSVAGITVILKPQEITTQTESDGSFSFPAQALDPSTTVTLDPQSLPSGLAPPAPAQLQVSQPVTITLRPSKKVEKVVF